MSAVPLSGILVIPRRFNGPPNSGNGGYACGLFSTLVAGAAEVTLRSPPPLERGLDVAHTPEGVEVLDGNTLIATVRPAPQPSPPVPQLPTWDETVQAAQSYLGFDQHEFPTCFTCGPDRSDGLGIFAGPLDDGLAAAPWTPDESLPHHDGVLEIPIVWAALDCPGAWVDARDLTVEPVVLGRMAAVIYEPVIVGESYIAMAWPLGGAGRKAYSGTALIDAAGTPVAVSRQTWIVMES